MSIPEKGFIFVLINPNQPDLVLIGSSVEHPERTLKRGLLDDPETGLTPRLRYTALINDTKLAIQFIDQNLETSQFGRGYFESDRVTAIKTIQRSGAELLYEEFVDDPTTSTTAISPAQQMVTVEAPYMREGLWDQQQIRINPRPRTWGPALRRSRRNAPTAYRSNIRERQLRKQNALKKLAESVEDGSPRSRTDAKPIETDNLDAAAIRNRFSAGKSRADKAKFNDAQQNPNELGADSGLNDPYEPNQRQEDAAPTSIFAESLDPRLKAKSTSELSTNTKTGNRKPVRGRGKRRTAEPGTSTLSDVSTNVLWEPGNTRTVSPEPRTPQNRTKPPTDPESLSVDSVIDAFDAHIQNTQHAAGEPDGAATNRDSKNRKTQTVEGQKSTAAPYSTETPDVNDVDTPASTRTNEIKPPRPPVAVPVSSKPSPSTPADDPRTPHRPSNVTPIPRTASEATVTGNSVEASDRPKHATSNNASSAQMPVEPGAKSTTTTQPKVPGERKTNTSPPVPTPTIPTPPPARPARAEHVAKDQFTTPIQPVIPRQTERSRTTVPTPTNRTPTITPPMPPPRIPARAPTPTQRNPRFSPPNIGVNHGPGTGPANPVSWGPPTVRTPGPTAPGPQVRGPEPKRHTAAPLRPPLAPPPIPSAGVGVPIARGQNAVPLTPPEPAKPPINPNEIESWVQDQEISHGKRSASRRAVRWALLGVPLGSLAGAAYLVFNPGFEQTHKIPLVVGSILVGAVVCYVLARIFTRNSDV